MHTIGNKIKKLRELRNFTQQHVAERLGISQPTYSTIESGELDITLSRLDEISKILGMRVEDVMAFDEKMVFNITTQHNSQNGTLLTQHIRVCFEIWFQIFARFISKKASWKKVSSARVVFS